MKRENAAADADPESVRLSIDTKAVINIGPYSRGGLSRGLRPVAAADHDMMAKEKLVPGGVLEMGSGRPFLFFTESCKTSDFMVDGIHLWWSENQGRMAGIKRLVINLDNGPECSGHRSQFLRRMVAFADREELEVRLIYYRLTTANTTGSNATGEVWSGRGTAICSTALQGFSCGPASLSGDPPRRQAPCSKAFTKRASNLAAKKSRSLKSGCRVQTTCHGRI